jgi:hypothetical protein
VVGRADISASIARCLLAHIARWITTMTRAYIKRLSILAVTVLGVGLLLLHLGEWYGRATNAVRVQCPYPGVGTRAIESLDIFRGGRFMIHVQTPATAGEIAQLHRELPPIVCDLEVVITGSDAFRANQKILLLHNGGWTPHDNLFLADEAIDIPSGGRYRIVIVSRTPVEEFCRRGAILRLARFEPSGHELLGTVFVVTGYVCIVSAAVLFMLRPK